MNLTTSWQLVSQTLLGYTGFQNVYLRQYARYSEQQIGNNRSYVYNQVRLYVETGNMTSGVTTTASISGVGSSQSNIAKNGTYYAGETTLLSQEGWVGHNSDGSKSITLTGRFRSTPWGWDKSLSKSVTLPKIPREANLGTVNNFNDEGNPYFTYSNPAGNAVSSLEVRLVHLTSDTQITPYQAVSKTGSNHTISLTTAQRNDLRNKMQSQPSANIMYQLRTLIGGTYYYSSKNATATIINANPTLNMSKVSFAVTDSVTNNLTGSNQKVIKSKSKVKLDFTSGAFETLKFATPKEVSISNFGVTVNQTISTLPMSVNFDNPISDKFLITFRDSRNNPVEEVYTVSFVDYKEPTLSQSEIERETNLSTATELLIAGTYDNVNFGAIANDIKFRYRYRIAGSEEWSSWISNRTLDTENNNWWFQDLIAGDLGAVGFAKSNSYEIHYEYFDKLTTYSTSIVLISANHNMVLHRNGAVSFGANYDNADLVIHQGNIWKRIDGVLEPLFVEGD